MYRDRDGIYHRQVALTFDEARVAKGQHGGGRFVSAGGGGLAAVATKLSGGVSAGKYQATAAEKATGKLHGGRWGHGHVEFHAPGDISKSLDPGVVADIHETMQRLGDAFPGAMESLHALTTNHKLGSGTLGAYLSFKHTGGKPFIALNPQRLGNKAKADAKCAEMEASGWLGKTGAPAGAALLTHEVGHHLDQSVRSRVKTLAGLDGPEQKKRAEALGAEYEKAFNELKPVSQYAKTNEHERAAEAVATGFLNPKAHPQAAEFVALLKKIYTNDGWVTQ